jgi:hypothetical protein
MREISDKAMQNSLPSYAAALKPMLRAFLSC